MRLGASRRLLPASRRQEHTRFTRSRFTASLQARRRHSRRRARPARREAPCRPCRRLTPATRAAPAGLGAPCGGVAAARTLSAVRRCDAARRTGCCRQRAPAPKVRVAGGRRDRNAQSGCFERSPIPKGKRGQTKRLFTRQTPILQINYRYFTRRSLMYSIIPTQSSERETKFSDCNPNGGWK